MRVLGKVHTVTYGIGSVGGGFDVFYAALDCVIERYKLRDALKMMSRGCANGKCHPFTISIGVGHSACVAKKFTKEDKLLMDKSVVKTLCVFFLSSR